MITSFYCNSLLRFIIQSHLRFIRLIPSINKRSLCLAFFIIFANSLDTYATNNLIQKILNDPNIFTCESTSYCNIPVLIKTYELRNFEFIWSKNSNLTQNAEDFIKFINSLEEEAIDPELYNLSLIQKTRDKYLKNRDQNNLAILDILLTDAFLRLSSHLMIGRISPNLIDENNKNNLNIDTGLLLLDLINSNKNVVDVLKILIPNNQFYIGLKKHYNFYRNSLESQRWKTFGECVKLEKGITHEKVQLLREILHKTRDYSGDRLFSLYFDNELELALKKFQKRHGLKPDGILGKKTCDALNVTLEERIEQIKVNMEIWRSLPKNFGDRFAIINIADFKLEIYDNGRKILEMKTIVGKPYRKTPLFFSHINQIVLNPPWHVPRTIAVNDFLPEIKKDVNFLHRKKLKVYAHTPEGVKQVDPSSINWAKYNQRNFNLYFVQPPGDFNSLGKIKFNLPNKFSVYLHGTPQTHLFERDRRDFSSGCVRLEKPLELALFLLMDEPSWTLEKIENILNKNITTYINIKNPLPIFFLYITSWVDENNELNFREDIYEREKLLKLDLKKSENIVYKERIARFLIAEGEKSDKKYE